MKLLIVSTGYYPYIGGVQTQVRLVANELAERHEVEVAAVAFYGRSPSPKWLRSLGKHLSDSCSWLVARTGMQHSAPIRLFRRTQSFCSEFGMYLFFKSYPSYQDGKVRVQTLAPSVFLRIPMMLRAAWLAFRTPLGQRREVFLSSFLDHLYLNRLRKVMVGKDLVHSFADGYLGWAAEKVTRERGLPFLLTPYVHPGQHGEDERHVAFYRRADRVFALLETGRDKLIELGVAPEKLRLCGVVPLLPDKVDPHAFRQRHGLQGRPIVLFLGRMMEYKGFKALLDAASLVWQCIPDVQFVFVGPPDGNSHETFVHYADPRIQYLGAVSEQEKGNALSACDVFCMPSVAEILPAVYLEVWSYGKPVVGGTAAGLKELIEGNEAGRVVSQDPQALAEVLVGMLRDPEQRARMGENGRTMVSERFTTDAVVKRFESVYREIIEPPRS